MNKQNTEITEDGNGSASAVERLVMHEPLIIDDPLASVGYEVTHTEKKKIVYLGELFKPWTWLKFECAIVFELINVDHVDVVNFDT